MQYARTKNGSTFIIQCSADYKGNDIAKLKIGGGVPGFMERCVANQTCVAVSLKKWMCNLESRKGGAASKSGDVDSAVLTKRVKIDVGEEGVEETEEED
ncbi:hypothetical protein LTS18_005893 [Coniosporium uncinatum]|uniref:Uncharacterized protein n=1 Tax=Coniosporium uncinatum TaxID=93489 RepID=A0ACC3DXP5_9PEZI|nr:hypothetical protein LTS18_005893 [Coniosporium uncinatum]